MPDFTLPAPPKVDPKIIHSLDKGLQVLELISSDQSPSSLSALTDALGWDKSTVFRLLTTLIRRGYVEQDSITKRYRLGYRILELNQSMVRSLDIPALTREVLIHLTEATRETSHIAVLRANSGVIIAQQNSPERVVVYADLGTLEPLHCTAVGKAFLMQLADDALEATVNSLDLVKYTPNTITSKAWLIEQIRRARATGYASDDEEFANGARCIAAPVLLPFLPQRFVIGISGPCSRMTGGRIADMAEHVIQAARDFQKLFENR